MNAAIYARKSTEQTSVTEENKSVTRQKGPARAFAVSRSWTVVAEFERAKMLKRCVSLVTGFAMWSMLLSAQAPQSVSQEQWVNTGVAVPPTTNLPRFVAKVDAGIVGALERVSMMFLDSSDETSLHTVLTFRVSEWVFGAINQKTPDRVELMMQGGTFVEQNGKRVPKRVAEGAENLVVGAEYFVPVETGDKYGKVGRLFVASPLAMSRLDGSNVASVVPRVTWSSEIVSKAKATAAAPGPAPTNRELFLMALRTAGRAK